MQRLFIHTPDETTSLAFSGNTFRFIVSLALPVGALTLETREGQGPFVIGLGNRWD